MDAEQQICSHCVSLAGNNGFKQLPLMCLNFRRNCTVGQVTIVTNIDDKGDQSKQGVNLFGKTEQNHIAKSFTDDDPKCEDADVQM